MLTEYTPFIQHGQMRISSESVTPLTAEGLLALNIGNRRMRERTVRQYAADMRAGHWIEKPVAICITTSGLLGNGQHTLAAIVASGMSQRLLISRNTPVDAVAVMDRGIVRTISDVAQMLGVDINTRRAAVAKILAYGINDAYGRSFHEAMDGYLQHQEVIEFAESVSMPKGAIGFASPIVAVFARAAYTQNRDGIARFAKVLSDGLAEGEHESAAIRLRDVVRGTTAATRASRLNLYAKCQSALDAFLRGKGITKLYGTSTELFKVAA